MDTTPHLPFLTILILTLLILPKPQIHNIQTHPPCHPVPNFPLTIHIRHITCFRKN